MRRNKRIKTIELPKEDPTRIAIAIPEPQAVPVEMPRREDVYIEAPAPMRIEPRKVEKG